MPGSKNEKLMLFDDIKNHLDITWSDEAGDKKLAGIIENGIQNINRIAGEKMNYNEAGCARNLLFKYCMYDREKRLHDFWTLYLPEIIALQVDCEVARFE